MGAGGGLSAPAMFALVTITGRETGQGSAMGIVNMTMSLGMILSPLICGWIMDMQDVKTVFSISALIVFIVIPVFLYLGKTHQSPLTIQE